MAGTKLGNDRDWTFHDAGALPLPLRLLNALGALRPSSRLLDPEAIVAAAQQNTGLSDFGGEEWREALDVVCDATNREGHNTAFGAMAHRALHTGLLERRLRLVDYAKKHPEVEKQEVKAPIVVLGLARTGTTLLSHLLDLDPRSRSLKSWEAATLVPPPTLAGRDTDPRIAEEGKLLDQMHSLIPPMLAMHPMEPMLATECVTLLSLDFRSLMLETQVLAPSYGRWLDSCDMRPAYRMHRLALQALQSTVPTGRWALKTPNHLWAIDALLETYPDARLIWTHRDPRKVIPSVSSVNMAFYRTYSSKPDPIAAGSHWAKKLLDGVSLGMAHDEKSADENWCQHVAYEELMKNPVETVRRVYAGFGEDLDPLHEQRMQVWMETRPQSTFGRHRYELGDFGFTNEGIDEMFSDYVERFDIARETRG